MDIDYEYIKAVLEEIKLGQSPYVQSSDIFIRYLGDNEESLRQFVFHWHLIVENGFISTNTREIYDLKGSGLFPNRQDPMKFTLSSQPIRLTSLGIEFLQSLQEPRVLEVIQDKFKNEGFSAVLEISKQLGVKLLNKRLEGIDL